MEAMFMEISGIQCDNKNCDFIDKSVKMEEYDEWLNKPCPKCGANLLTEEDYTTVKNLTSYVKAMSGMMPKAPESVVKEDYEKVEFELDGSGYLKVKED